MAQQTVFEIPAEWLLLDEQRRENARRLRGIAADANALADLWDPPTDGLLSFGELEPGMSIKVGGEWGCLVSVSHGTHSLYVDFGGGRTTVYPADQDELFLTESPF